MNFFKYKIHKRNFIVCKFPTFLLGSYKFLLTILLWGTSRFCKKKSYFHWPYYQKDWHALFSSLYNFLNGNRETRWFIGYCLGKYQYTTYYVKTWYSDPALKQCPSYQLSNHVLLPWYLTSDRECMGATNRFTINLSCQTHTDPTHLNKIIWICQFLKK